MGEGLIDIILAFVIGIIALIAIIMIPSNEKIQNNEVQGYKSKKAFVFAAGGAALFMGVLAIILYSTDEDSQNLVKVFQMIFFLAMGAALIGVNVKKSRLLAQAESQQAVVAAETVPTEVVAQRIGVKAQITAPVQTVPVQQIGIKGQPAQVQQRVAVQQIGIKQTPVQPQPQVAAAPKPAARPAQQPRIVVIKCPKCNGDMQISTAMLGQKIKCPHCGVEGKIG